MTLRAAIWAAAHEWGDPRKPNPMATLRAVLDMPYSDLALAFFARVVAINR